MVRNDQVSTENAIYASISSLKSLKVINSHVKYFQSSLPSQCGSFKHFHENLPPSTLPHLLFSKVDDSSGFKHF